MKTILLVIVVLFSLTNAFSQKTITSIDPQQELLKTKQSTKEDFFKTLIALNDFDIKLKKVEKVVKAAKFESKIDFYEALMNKNKFSKEYTQLANGVQKDRKNINTLDTTEVTGL